MKKTLKTILAIPVVLALLLTGCSLDDPDHPTDLKAPTGDRIFANYVSIGNSLTAGFMDGGLIQSGQNDSYPYLIAQQIGFGDEFTQPWVAAPGIGSSLPSAPGQTAGVLHFDGASITVLDETASALVPTLLLAAAQPTPYHNLGVPGATLVDVFNTTSSANSYPGPNPFFDFINRYGLLYGSEERTATILNMAGTAPRDVTYETASMGWQAIAKGPTLLTVFIGNNDALGWATRGGDQSVVPLTDPSTFAQQFSDMLQLLAGGLVERTGFPPTIVIGNVAGVSSAPYFVPTATFTQLASGALGVPWTGGFDEAGASLVRFPALSTLTGPTTDITAEYTLTATEVTTATNTIAQYNGAIDLVAAGVNASGMAIVRVVDVNAILADIAAGTSAYGPLAGQHFMVALAQTGTVAAASQATLFSLDGLHPNNRGYAVVANAFIEEINDAADTDVADVDVASKVWDPTYSWYSPAVTKADDGGVAGLSARAAAQMDAVFR
ncbi:MAG: hypothetical protein GY838_08205 [bacterium]|nr:hypothetical protein [bacterium]